MSDHLSIDDSLDVAIVGMACRLPGARDPDELWRVLRAGTECIRAFTDDELLALGVPRAALGAEGFVKAGAVLTEIDRFDAAFFGYSPREAELLDPQHRVFLECAWEALERAGHVPSSEQTVGVFAGSGLSTYLLFNLVARPELSEAVESFQTMIGNDKDFLATKLSYLLDLRGPSLTIQTGCSTSLVAVHLACQSLLGYQCDVAIAGGAAVQVPQRTGYHYQPGGIASPDGHCRPFDADAAGTIFGSGAGVVVLKRLASAIADGDHIHAVIRGSAINNDGATKLGYTAPSVEGQVEVITRAQAMAGVTPDTIGFVETHGTATALGDSVEIEALARVFRADPALPGTCALGSIKSNLGHLDAAAGVVGLIKGALAVEHGEVPPTLHFRTPSPRIAWQHTPFFVNADLRPWPRAEGRRRAGVSSFGIGGTNAHVVLEEPPARAPVASDRPHHLLVLSAKTPAALEEVTRALAAHLAARPELPIAEVAHTLQLGRRALAHRRAVVVTDAADAARALAELPPHRCGAGEAARRRVVFMFPGGGAQHTAMGRGLYAHEPVFREQLDACAELLAPRLGVHLRDVIYPPAAGGRGAAPGAGAERLTRTAVALPALFAVEYALAQLWLSWGVEPDAMIGHSMGEYVAACLAGVLSLEDALALVAERGRLFELAPKGAMLNVELPEAELKALCGDRLSIAAINGPTQGVVAGDQGTIEGLAAELGARGIEARRVHIDVAAHSHMIEPIIPAFEAFLRTLRLSAPRRPFLSCVTGAWITEAEAQSVDYWVRHLRHTVRFGAGVRALLAGPATVLLEVGPGRTLSSLARQQLAPGGESLALTSMRAPAEDRPDPEVLLTTAGRLWAAGVGLDFAALGGPGRQRVILPTYPWERRRFWIDPPDPAAPRAAGRDASAGAGDAGRAERSELAAWFHLPAWRPALPPAATGAASWLVLCEPTGLGAQVADQLASRGHRVTTVVPGGALRRVSERGYELDPSAPDACAALLAELVRAQRRPDRIAFCWGLVEAPPGADAVDHARRYGLDPLISLGQALGAMADAARAHLAIVTSGVQSVSGSDPLRPERALVLGPCRVLPIELPGVTCALVDVEEGAGSSGRGDPELAAAAVARVVAELEGPAECAVVALRGGRRWVQAFEPVPVPAAGAGSDAGVPRGPTLRAGGTYLVTGGLGGIGQVLAAHLARRHCARVALLGRSHVPPRGDWPAWIADHPADDATTARIRALQALDALGSEVVYVGADVADPDDVARALAEVRAQLGAIHGVIHAAGVPASGLIQVKEAAAVTAVLRPKVAGTLALERALAADPAAPPLDFFLVCSSRTATTGDLGQVDHAAANAFLEAFAEQRTQQGRAGVIALAWDTWAEVGQAVTTAIPGGLEAVRAQLLAHAIQPAEGPEVLERALGSGASRVIVSTRPLAIAAAASRQLGHDLHALAGGGAGEDRGAAPAGAAVTGAALEHAIAQIWSRVLRIERVGLDESFFDLGGNSVLGLRLVAELKRELGIAVSAAALFESPTVAALARRFGGAAVTEAPAFEERKSRGARRRESHARRHDRK